MKNIYLITFLTFFKLCFGQEIAFNYFTYNVFKIENISSQEISNISKFNELIDTNFDVIQYELKMNNFQGKFTPIEKINNSQSLQFNFNSAFIKTQGEFFFDNRNKEVQNKKDFANNSYIVEYPFTFYDWKIEEEEEVILNYNCKKAVYQKTDLGLKEDKIYTITVWYDESFNSDIAPFGLHGLPGLVVKVNFNNNYEVLLDKMEEKNEFKVLPYKHGERISMEHFQSLVNKVILDFRKRNSPSGID